MESKDKKKRKEIVHHRSCCNCRAEQQRAGHAHTKTVQKRGEKKPREKKKNRRRRQAVCCALRDGRDGPGGTRISLDLLRLLLLGKTRAGRRPGESISKRQKNKQMYFSKIPRPRLTHL